jgi:hypothetical protein
LEKIRKENLKKLSLGGKTATPGKGKERNASLSGNSQGRENIGEKKTLSNFPLTPKSKKTNFEEKKNFFEIFHAKGGNKNSSDGPNIRLSVTNPIVKVASSSAQIVTDQMESRIKDSQ